MDDIIAIEYDITPNIANMLKLGQDLADMTNRAEELATQLATANEARQQLQDALHVRDTQLAAATKRAEDANQYALGMEAAANTAAAERDNYREKFRTMEREAELLRSQLIAMQLRAENAESALRSANVKIVRLEERVGIHSSQPRE